MRKVYPQVRDSFSPQSSKLVRKTYGPSTGTLLTVFNQFKRPLSFQHPLSYESRNVQTLCGDQAPGVGNARV